MTTITDPTAGDTAVALARAINQHPLFAHLLPTHLALLAQSAMFSEFKAGELIFREGDPANRFYLIMEGEVALESPVRDAEPVQLQTIGAGDVLGWSWLFPPFRWFFAARATKPTRAIFFYGSWLRDKCEQDPAFGYEMLKRMAGVILQRLQATRRELLKLSRPG